MEVLLEIFVYLRFSESKQFFSFVSAAAALGFFLICCGRRLCHPAIVGVFCLPTIPLQWFYSLSLNGIVSIGVPALYKCIIQSLVLCKSASFKGVVFVILSQLKKLA